MVFDTYLNCFYKQTSIISTISGISSPSQEKEYLCYYPEQKMEIIGEFFSIHLHMSGTWLGLGICKGIIEVQDR